MKRLILRYAGAAADSKAASDRVRGLPSLSVLDATAKMMLVEVPDRLAKRLPQLLPMWRVSDEVEVELPAPLPKLRVRK